ncbi:MAG: hypothetical protein QOC70_2168, partial [Verrucomicrobiota bacterium]
MVAAYKSEFNPATEFDAAHVGNQAGGKVRPLGNEFRQTYASEALGQYLMRDPQVNGASHHATHQFAAKPYWIL